MRNDDRAPGGKEICDNLYSTYQTTDGLDMGYFCFYDEETGKCRASEPGRIDACTGP